MGASGIGSAIPRRYLHAIANPEIAHAAEVFENACMTASAKCGRSSVAKRLADGSHHRNQSPNEAVYRSNPRACERVEKGPGSIVLGHISRTAVFAVV